MHRISYSVVIRTLGNSSEKYKALLDSIQAQGCQPEEIRLTLQELKELIEKPLTEDEETVLLDIDLKPIKTGYSDEEVWQLLEMYSGATNSSQFQAIPRPLQKHYLYMVHEEGVGPHTLSRLTGVTYSVVQKATSAAKERYIQEQYVKRQSSVVCESNPIEEEWLTY